jgi:hypothetical protein
MAFEAALHQEGVTRAWAFDEGRFGLKLWFRRRWCPYKVRPPWIVEDRYEWLWVYVAVRPDTGDCFILYLPFLNTDCVQVFVDAFGTEVGETEVGLILDGSGSHQAITWPAHVHPLRLPAYSPELNPAESVFRHLRTKLANRLFETLDDLEAAITTELRTFWDTPAVLKRLTGYPWWLKATSNIVPASA